ncbi:hypothetical protein GE061_015204 [Apolygus lucorum]|uniref:Uncharacterized protein n=1 Tax=Apolygus lucorum TaxID=248454 RepID=A0A8S9XKE7_APOLU|nr:hypothetical protein GE061_015204 [Apolygus lucorum]
MKDITSSSGEVIIEECSIIEEEIIPPEKASTPLPLSVFLRDESSSLETKEVSGEHDVQKGTVIDTISEKSSLCGISLQTTSEKRCPVTSSGELIRDTKSKLRMPQPRADKVGAQMAYLIPYRGVITPPANVKSSNYPSKGKPKIPDGGQSITSDVTKRKLVTPRRMNQKKRISRNPGNPIALKNTSSAPSGIHSSCLDERSKIEKR